jgi:hypothetical protein
MNAADLGEPLTDDNARFMSVLSALAMVARVEITGSEIAHVAELARTVIPRSRNQWSDAQRQLDWCDDNEDFTGLTVAQQFDDAQGGMQNTRNPAVADALLERCGPFYRVPWLYQPLVAEATRVVMQGCQQEGWTELPVAWSQVYHLIVAAIVARCKPDDFPLNGNHRRGQP